MADAQAIQTAIEQLVKNSLANRAKIEKGKASSASLRDEIQVTSLELERDALSLNVIDKRNLSLVRKVASEDDCIFLKSSMDIISKQIKDNQTTQALALMEPLAQNVSLLRKRLQYIAELEQLLVEYEQEKLLRTKLKAVAEALGLPTHSAEEASNKAIDYGESQQVTAPLTDTYLVEETALSSTLH